MASLSRSIWGLLIVLAGTASAVCAAQTKAAGATKPGTQTIRCRGLAGCKGVDAESVIAPAPELPQLAKTAHIRGVVRLTAVVDEHGSVQSLTFVSGHPFLVAAAIDTAKGYRFEPASMRGIAILSIQLLEVTFAGSWGDGGVEPVLVPGWKPVCLSP